MRHRFAFAILMLASSIAQSPAATIEEEFRAAHDKIDTPETQKAFLELNRARPAPDGFVFSFASCNNGIDYCAHLEASLALELPYAYRGVYQAQRNVALCLSTSCEGATVPNATLGCAWRIVILASGSPRVDQTDLSNHRLCASQLDGVGLAVAKAQAGQLFETIYSRPLPGEWW